MNDIQKVILDIYKVIKKICENNGIEYFAIGGTCIGAVRHQGFIPWDDDIDIAIPIEQFNYFRSVCNKELPDYYRFFDYMVIPEYPNVFSKIIDIRTTYIEDHEKNNPQMFKGVFVDLMPIGGIPSDEKEREKYFEQLRHNINFNKLRRAGMLISTNKAKRMIKKMILPMVQMLNVNTYTDKIFEDMISRPFYMSEITGYTWGIYDERYLSFPTEWFLNPVSIPFEDTEILCPSNYDAYLKYQFGDYMKIPPLEEQTSRHHPFVDLNRPFSFYQQNPQRLP